MQVKTQSNRIIIVFLTTLLMVFSIMLLTACGPKVDITKATIALEEIVT